MAPRARRDFSSTYRLLLFSRPRMERPAPRPRAAFPLAPAERFPASFENASSTRPAILSSAPSVLSRLPDFATSAPFVREERTDSNRRPPVYHLFSSGPLAPRSHGTPSEDSLPAARVVQRTSIARRSATNGTHRLSHGARVRAISTQPRGVLSLARTRLSSTTTSVGTFSMRNRSTRSGRSAMSILCSRKDAWFRRSCNTCARNPSTRRELPDVRE